jgi:stage III sporulation protein AE
MKKLISLFLATLLCAMLSLLSLPVFASDEEAMSIAAAEIGVDVDELQEGVPDSAEDLLNDRGITPTNTEAMTSINPGEILGYLWDTVKSKAAYPLKIFAAIVAVIMLSAVVEGLGDTIADKKLTKIYGIICVIVAVSVISSPVSETIHSAAQALNDGGIFMAGYIPVFSGITASSGHFTSAASYSLIVIFASDAAVLLASNFMIPILSICMALGIVEAINPNFSLTGITNAVQTGTKVIITFIMVVFLGLLSTQSIIGASADTLGVKAAKFAASNFIPVVGSAVADAYTTVKASLGLLRGGVGFFGIAAIFLLAAPPLIEVGLMRLAFSAAELVTDVFGVNSVKILLKNTVKILSLIFSVLVCFAVMLIISTAIVMLIGLNAY